MPEELAEAAQAKDCWQWFRISKRDLVISCDYSRPCPSCCWCCCCFVSVVVSHVAVGVGFVGSLRELSGYGGWWLESC